MRTRIRTSARFAATAIAVALVAVACGSSSKASNGTTAPAGTAKGPATGAVGTNPAAAGGGAGIKLAVNPWTGSAVNANVAKIVLESKLGTPTTLVPLDENASWVGLDAGDLDANLEIWPSGHAADYQNYVTQKKSVVDLGLLGP
ncbi:MAG: glycine betaine ABC transporter substrate-binding protein, partial [Ilumatobacteraceae bacterium]